MNDYMNMKMVDQVLKGLERGGVGLSLQILLYRQIISLTNSFCSFETIRITHILNMRRFK